MHKSLRKIIAIKKIIHYIIPSIVILNVNVCFFDKHIVDKNHIKL